MVKKKMMNYSFQDLPWFVSIFGIGLGPNIFSSSFSIPNRPYEDGGQRWEDGATVVALGVGVIVDNRGPSIQMSSPSAPIPFRDSSGLVATLGGGPGLFESSGRGSVWTSGLGLGLWDSGYVRFFLPRCLELRF
ncbi:hypothetical protein RIF29_25752 [Crotalaria pallida]|uniref:Uncharacterized protein n=1 Tax=Crotalaria pallida TaxID=3830 RepID=A0AAN9I4F8_CROPI